MLHTDEPLATILPVLGGARPGWAMVTREATEDGLPYLAITIPTSQAFSPPIWITIEPAPSGEGFSMYHSGLDTWTWGATERALLRDLVPTPPPGCRCVCLTDHQPA